MGSPSSISIDNDLSSRESSISVGSANDEFSGGVDDDLGLFAKIFLGNNFLDNIFNELLSKEFVLGGHLIIVLGGNGDGMDPLGNHGAVDILVDNGNLRLSVRSDPVEDAVLSNVGQSLSELGSPNVG